MDAVAPRLSPPVGLSDQHQLDGFRCTEPSLEHWLKETARSSHARGGSRVVVTCADGLAVVGYYCLSASVVQHEDAPGAIRRNMPNPIPVLLLGRLAVHADWAGHGIGTGLLQDAVRRTLGLAEQVGIRALLCHAISEDAKRFYLKRGFIQSPINPMTVMLSIALGYK